MVVTDEVTIIKSWIDAPEFLWLEMGVTWRSSPSLVSVLMVWLVGIIPVSVWRGVHLVEWMVAVVVAPIAFGVREVIGSLQVREF